MHAKTKGASVKWKCKEKRNLISIIEKRKKNVYNNKREKGGLHD